VTTLDGHTPLLERSNGPEKLETSECGASLLPYAGWQGLPDEPDINKFA